LPYCNNMTANSHKQRTGGKNNSEHIRCCHRVWSRNISCDWSRDKQLTNRDRSQPHLVLPQYLQLTEAGSLVQQQLPLRARPVRGRGQSWWPRMASTSAAILLLLSCPAVNAIGKPQHSPWELPLDMTYARIRKCNS
jgi:hypothetical protein